DLPIERPDGFHRLLIIGHSPCKFVKRDTYLVQGLKWRRADCWNAEGPFPAEVGAASLLELLLDAPLRWSALPGPPSGRARTRPTHHDRSPTGKRKLKK